MKKYLASGAVALIILASCTSEIKKRDRHVEKAVFNYMDSLFKSRHTGLAMDSVRAFFVDTQFKAEYNKLLEDVVSKWTDEQSRLAGYAVQEAKRDARMMELLSSGGYEYEEYRDKYNTAAQAYNACVDSLQQLQEMADKLKQKEQPGDATLFYGFKTKVVLCYRDEGVSKRDTEKFYLYPNYTINLPPF